MPASASAPRSSGSVSDGSSPTLMMPTITRTRSIMTAPATRTPAAKTLRRSPPARASRAMLSVTAVDDTSPLASPESSTSIDGPARQIAAYPANDSAAMTMVSSQISCGFTGKAGLSSRSGKSGSRMTVIASRIRPARSSSHVSRFTHVQRGFEREQQGRGNACCGGRRLVAHHRERVEGERQHGRDHGRCAEDLVVHHLAVAEECDRGREGGERKGERDHASLAGIQRERAPDAAEQPRKRERAQAVGPLPLGLSALPAPGL
jgi:hypothetical protein